MRAIPDPQLVSAPLNPIPIPIPFWLICVTGLTEPLPHYSLFYGQL